MRVRRSSWHFRMYRFLISCWSEGPDVFKGRRTQHVPRDLCHYFWTIFLMTLTIPLWVGIVIAGGLLYGLLLILLFLFEFGPRRLWERNKRWREARRPWREEEDYLHPPKQNLVVSFVRARKEKVCPVIKVVDE